MGVKDELKDRIELLELGGGGGLLLGLQGCFESLIHGHRVLRVLEGASVLSKATHRV